MGLDWHTLLGTFATLVIVGLLPFYIKSTFSGTTRPSTISWFGWALLSAIDAVAQASKGIDWSLAILVVATFSQSIVFLIALRKGKMEWTKLDSASIAIAIASLVLWFITKEPLAALILNTVADLGVTLPTIIKTYQEPDSEPAILWRIYVLACVLLIIATRELTIYNLLVPVYTVIADGTIALFAKGRLES